MDNHIFTNMLKNRYRVLGVMSGTSLDGIDLCAVDFNFTNCWSFDIVTAQTIAYSEKWKKKLSEISLKSHAEIQDIDEELSNSF